VTGRRRRLAAALVIPGEVGQEIDGLRRALGARALARIPPHVTLVPPVNVREEELSSTVEIVRRAGQQSRPLALELGPVATFFPRSPVVYLEVGGDLEGLGVLRGALEVGPLASPPGRQHREREFVPHVTLDQRIAPDRIPAALVALASYRAAVTLDRVTLLEFLEEERRWVALADAALAPASVVGRGGLEVELSVSTMPAPDVVEFERRVRQEDSEEAAGGGASLDEPYVVTARIAGEIVGVASGQLRGEHVRLASLIVAPEWRSHGVGRHLMAAVEQLAREHGAELVRVETRAESRSVSFFRNLGYGSQRD
jgi:2'-5' RNA ligase